MIRIVPSWRCNPTDGVRYVLECIQPTSQPNRILTDEPRGGRIVVAIPVVMQPRLCVMLPQTNITKSNARDAERNRRRNRIVPLPCPWCAFSSRRCEISIRSKGASIEPSRTHGASPSSTILCAAASICVLETLSTITTPVM